MTSEKSMIGLALAAFAIGLVAILARPAPTMAVTVYGVTATTQAPVLGPVPEIETFAALTHTRVKQG